MTSSSSPNPTGWSRRRAVVVAMLLFGTVTLIGTLGYVVLEGWSVWDAFYMTMISVTTAGYKEVHDMGFFGQL